MAKRINYEHCAVEKSFGLLYTHNNTIYYTMRESHKNKNQSENV